jgi:acetyl-CoA acetyltransferase family protein
VNHRDAAIPLGAAWSSPFVRWQGSLADVNSVDLAGQVTRDALERAGIDAARLDSIVLGITVPQKESFFGGPTLAAKIGAPDITGPMLSQACATSAKCVEVGAATADAGEVVAVITTDRTSNGPLLTYPSSSGPGGSPTIEHWILDNFKKDPWAGQAMVDTAEAVASEAGIDRAELDELTLLRYEQYEAALADDRAFQRRWMIPVTVPRRGRDPLVVGADDGIYATTAEGLAKLSPQMPDGVVTFGTQTHPADGTAGMVIAPTAVARELSGGRGIAQVLGTGFSRVEKARMPKAPVPAALAALEDAGLSIDQVDAVKSHNPFAVNDVWFARQTGFAIDRTNAFGCSLIYGHPQGPTGARAIVELIAELEARGGGIGLFTGCAAGDTGGAVVIRVDG